ncbi:cilia- and flagella-associated protein 57-like isoform X2 [Portunus trituberculatus]|uniref:cilia- and flagella-associated protein 57-like isoform X2 n=1 Tax=Portunus trituberculatus TaxID=210409 RepID=UPI001E1CDFE3|nr:cilia- and flagella-associated protein 57-like isoform X2 [Portunus trituberculatus]
MVQRECEEKSLEVSGLTEERGKLQVSVKGLEREMAALRREVKHRDDIIRDREGQMSSTREHVEELEKQRFLLDHQMSVLKEELQPLQVALEQRAQQIKQMEEEVSETRLVVGARDRQVKELSQRLATAGQQGRYLQQRHHALATALTRVLADLATATTLLHQPKKLKEAIKTLHDKHVRSGKHKEFWTRPDLDKLAASGTDPTAQAGGVVVPPAEEEEAVCELLRQREMLERSVATLRARAEKQDRAHKDKVTTLVKENTELLERVRELEERAWRLEGEARRAESLAGLRDPRSCRKKASRDHLVQTLSRQADTIARLQQQLREAQTTEETKSDNQSNENPTAKPEEGEEGEKKKEPEGKVESNDPGEPSTNTDHHHHHRYPHQQRHQQEGGGGGGGGSGGIGGEVDMTLKHQHIVLPHGDSSTHDLNSIAP